MVHGGLIMFNNIVLSLHYILFLHHHNAKYCKTVSQIGLKTDLFLCAFESCQVQPIDGASFVWQRAHL